MSSPFRIGGIFLALQGPPATKSRGRAIASSPPSWEEGPAPDFLLSVNDQMLQARERLLDVAATRLPVALLGERGVGKEAIAHTLHRWSNHAAGPFVRVGCKVIPRARLGAELFGDPSGGARPFDRARHGTLLLSGIEISDGELCDRLASMLAPAHGDAAEDAPRVVLASEEVEAQGPRKRLLERLARDAAGVVIVLPPLRSRPEDIGLLAQHLLQLYSPFYSSRIKQVRSSLVDLFQQYSWPGNVRELEHVIRRFLVVEDESKIRRELEAKNARINSGVDDPEDVPGGLTLSEIGKLAAQRAEARAIRRMLERTRWNKKAAAQELGVSYKSLLNKVRDYRLDA